MKNTESAGDLTKCEGSGFSLRNRKERQIGEEREGQEKGGQRITGGEGRGKRKEGKESNYRKRERKEAACCFSPFYLSHPIFHCQYSLNGNLFLK